MGRATFDRCGANTLKNPIILHVNCVEQGQTIEEMCERAVAWGCDGIEFRRKRAGVEETPEQYLDAIARAQKRTGMKRVQFGGPGPNLMSMDAAERRRSLDECAAFYRAAAKRFKLTVCNTMTGTVVAPNAHYLEFDKNGSAVATEEQWAWAVEGFKELGALAQELGFKFAFETHNCFIHDLPSPTLRLVERIGSPSVGVNFDYSNICINPAGCSLEEAFGTLKDYIFEAHLQNCFKLHVQKYYNFISCGLKDGVINVRKEIRLLKEAGFNGPLVVETPRDGDRETFAQEDLSTLRRLLAEEWAE